MKTFNQCETCKKELRGRSDKRFCDYICRNHFHNQQSAANRTSIRQVNRRLRRNHQILKRYLKERNTPVPAPQLEESGFDFSLHTGMCTVAENKPCYFCYDVGYFPAESGYFALVTSNEGIV